MHPSSCPFRSHPKKKKDPAEQVECLLSMNQSAVIAALPWDTFPYWGHPDDFDLPVYSHGDGAMIAIGRYFEE
jgi:hypothetical protein